MRNNLVTTISLAVALATATGATAFPGNPPPDRIPPASPGACNMLHANEQGFEGMFNDRHVFDIMIPFIVASLDAGCVEP
jgi:hypothetical protein